MRHVADVLLVIDDYSLSMSLGERSMISNKPHLSKLNAAKSSYEIARTIALCGSCVWFEETHVDFL